MPSDWAFWAVVVAAIQAVLSFVGILLVWGTLKSTKAAVIEAGNSSKSAEEAVKVAKSSAEKQLRAYVYPTLSSLHVNNLSTIDGGKFLEFQLTVDIKNVGSTPAERLRAGGHIKAHDWPDDGVAKRPGSMTDFPAIAPGRVLPITFTQLTSVDYLKITSDSQRVFVTVQIEYHDVFGYRRVCEYHATVNNLNESLGAIVSGSGVVNLTFQALNDRCVGA